MKQRTIAWFSCGAASAVAAKYCPDALIVNCDTRPSENPDNYRFCFDCQKWWGRPITFIRNDKYKNIDEVFEKTRYMAGVNGARCTTELKKMPRLEFSYPDDIHVFGFCFDEQKRIREFKQRNPELYLRFILSDLKITKAQCYRELQQAGITLPVMYTLSDENGHTLDNNNCPCCVKGSSPWYWSMMRRHFPVEFARRAAQSRELGVRLVEIHHHERIFLDELPSGPFKKWRGKKKEILSCGPECASPGIATA